MKTYNDKKLKMQKIISLLIIVIGIVLMTFMVIVEDEPGALPLFIILIGIGWYFFLRHKVHSMHA